MTFLLPATAFLAATIALLTDVRGRRIPNWLTLSALAVGVVANLITGGADGMGSALAGAAIGFGLLLPFYLVGAMGAGDVKLLAALGALLGPQTLLVAATAAALVGGGMSVVILARRGRLSLAAHQLFVMRTVPTPSGAKAPYAVAIASGVYLALLQQLFRSASV